MTNLRTLVPVGTQHLRGAAYNSRVNKIRRQINEARVTTASVNNEVAERNSRLNNLRREVESTPKLREQILRTVRQEFPELTNAQLLALGFMKIVESEQPAVVQSEPAQQVKAIKSRVPSKVISRKERRERERRQQAFLQSRSVLAVLEEVALELPVQPKVSKPKNRVDYRAAKLARRQQRKSK